MPIYHLTTVAMAADIDLCVSLLHALLMYSTTKEPRCFKTTNRVANLASQECRGHLPIFLAAVRLVVIAAQAATKKIFWANQDIRDPACSRVTIGMVLPMVVNDEYPPYLFFGTHQIQIYGQFSNLVYKLTKYSWIGSQYKHTKNQFTGKSKELRQIRDHIQKALGKENPDLRGLFL